MFCWDPKPEIITLPFVRLPILWYGAFFAIGFAMAFPLFVSILARYFSTQGDYTKPDILKKKAIFLADKLTVYIVIATIVGARLGHFLFYEKPSLYLNHPLEIFKIWEGGLASHGAALGILLATYIFSRRIGKKFGLSWLRLLDFIAVPAPLAGACIRIGNFFNQEILGKATSLPWGVVFGHPADHSAKIARHPVQLYEAGFYFAVFLGLWVLTYQPKFFLAKGKLFGLFLVLVFSFRFVIEFLKIEQSELFSGSAPLTMGQLLSLPAILLGIILLLTKFSEIRYN